MAQALMDAGFEPDAPSLLLCEGVAVYFEPAVLAGLLTQLRSVATAGTRLAMSAVIPDADPGRRAAFAARVAGLGEPIALAGADAGALLAAARWRPAELSERAQRAGLVVGVPVWEPGAPPTISRIGTYLERTFHRDRLDRLADHLTTTYDVQVVGTRRLDIGVVRVDRADGPSWVARIFPRERPLDLADRDADVLRYLAAAGYPAERIADPDPVSELAGQAVLVTQFVEGKAPRATQAAFRQLGELLGRLHTLPHPPTGSGGAWHHLTFGGGPDAEIAALENLLDARSHVPQAQRQALAMLRGQVAELDDLHGLPQAFTHPDFVAVNAIDRPDGPVIIDWTGAGIAPRLWTFAFLVWSAGQAGPRYVDAVVQGYRQHVQPVPAELERLESAVTARPLIFDAWAYATGRRPLPDVMVNRAGVDAKARDVADRARAAFRIAARP